MMVTVGKWLVTHQESISANSYPFQ